LRALIRQISTENLLWGAPRISTAELLKLGVLASLNQVSPSTWSSDGRASKSGNGGPFLRNPRAGTIAAMDFVRSADHWL